MQGITITSWLASPFWLPFAARDLLHQSGVFGRAAWVTFVGTNIVVAVVFCRVGGAPFLPTRSAVSGLLLGHAPLVVASVLLPGIIRDESPFFLEHGLIVCTTCALVGVAQTSVGVVRLLARISGPWRAKLETTVWGLCAALAVGVVPFLVDLDGGGTLHAAMIVLAVMGFIASTVALGLINVATIYRLHQASGQIGVTSWEDAEGSQVQLVDLQGGLALVDDGGPLRLEPALDWERHLVANGYVQR